MAGRRQAAAAAGQGSGGEPAAPTLISTGLRTIFPTIGGREGAGKVPEYADETAYYLNGKLPRLALIAKGIKFPPGRWIRVAGVVVLPGLVQELVADLFPALGGHLVPLVTLLTDFDVQEFERELEGFSLGLAR